jgi:hypothetical protein
VAKQKPPLSIRVWTDRGAAGLSRAVTVFSPDELRRQGMEEARFKKHALGQRRLAVVYNVVKDDIGRMSDDKCADLHFGAVNAMLRQVIALIAVDMRHEESNPNATRGTGF